MAVTPRTYPWTSEFGGRLVTFRYLCAEDKEIEDAMEASRGVDIVTMGQYLQPTKRHLEVIEFVTPEKFARLR